MLNNFSRLSPMLFFFLVALVFFSCDTNNKIPIIIDADTANEVDDLYALVYAIKEPRFNILGITSAQFHTSPLATETTVLESQKINEDILRLMKREDIPLPIGSNSPLTSSKNPAESEASDFIISEAHKASKEKKLKLVILGSCTNVASAILKDSTIIPKIQVNYLGFWHDVTTNRYDKKEFNSGNDTLAVEVLLNTKNLDLKVMTATTSQHLIFKKTNVDNHLKGKKGIANYLVNRWETYSRWWTDEDPKQKEWIMWDVALLMALAHPELAIEKKFKTPSENIQRNIDIYTCIEASKMTAAFWESMNNL
ncbi:MAG: nucleoside hydrolase [Maribacter sp.]